TGPDKWQRDFLIRIGQAMRDNNFDGFNAVKAIREATASGHGIGKSALVSWLTQFIMSTRPFCNGTITANTMAQLQTKTFKEINKWHDLLINKHWFDISVGGLRYWAKGFKSQWYAAGQTCREENAEAFAGQHNTSSTSFYLFDEASKIAPLIWETAEGGLTDGEPMMFAFGNPTQNSGKFKECFGARSHRWNTTQVDSRESKITNKEQIQEWIEDYGEDSDFVRVRVRGVFPRASSSQFFSSEDITRAMLKDVPDKDLTGLTRTIACDVARFGDDETIISERWGNRIIILERYQGQNTMWTAGRIALYMSSGDYSDCIIDDTGVGGGVTDRILQLGYHVTAVNNAESAMDTEKYNAIKSEMYDNFRKWLKTGSIPNIPDIQQQFESIEYFFTGKQQIAMTPKKVLKKQGLKSPDICDSFALHLAYPTAPANERYKPMVFESEWA
ncbi:MAG: terminase, partial [Desulfobulbaceae bacterium]|nr:terminase [Desulfobulbaceae bacterium]